MTPVIELFKTSTEKDLKESGQVLSSQNKQSSVLDEKAKSKAKMSCEDSEKGQADGVLDFFKVGRKVDQAFKKNKGVELEDRGDKLLRLKELIEKGEYWPDPEQVADVMVEKILSDSEDSENSESSRGPKHGSET